MNLRTRCYCCDEALKYSKSKAKCPRQLILIALVISTTYSTRSGSDGNYKRKSVQRQYGQRSVAIVIKPFHRRDCLPEAWNSLAKLGWLISDRLACAIADGLHYRQLAWELTMNSHNQNSCQSSLDCLVAESPCGNFSEAIFRFLVPFFIFS